MAVITDRPFFCVSDSPVSEITAVPAPLICRGILDVHIDRRHAQYLAVNTAYLRSHSVCSPQDSPCRIDSPPRKRSFPGFSPRKYRLVFGSESHHQPAFGLADDLDSLAQRGFDLLLLCRSNILGILSVYEWHCCSFLMAEYHLRSARPRGIHAGQCSISGRCAPGRILYRWHCASPRRRFPPSRSGTSFPTDSP